MFAQVHHGIELWLACSWLGGNNTKRLLVLFCSSLLPSGHLYCAASHDADLNNATKGV